MTFSEIWHYIAMPIVVLEIWIMYRPRNKLFSRLDYWMLSVECKRKLDYLKAGELWVARDILKPIVKDSILLGKDPVQDKSVRLAAKVLHEEITSIDVRRGIVYTKNMATGIAYCYTIYTWVRIFYPTGVLPESFIEA